MTTRVSKEPERPRRFHRQSGWETGTDNSLAPGGTPTIEGSKPRATRWYRLVQTNRDERRGVGASHSIVEAGEPPEGPRGEKGTPCHDTVGGKHGGCIETLNRANKTTTDRGVGYETDG